ncbi:hypothetical protein B5G03_00550 [Gemmiger sp. An50]|nr:hypothetical protein B5G03_00550 [Gemmiger sp. An50]
MGVLLSGGEGRLFIQAGMPPVKAYAAGIWNEYSFGRRPASGPGRKVVPLSVFYQMAGGNTKPAWGKNWRFFAFFAKFLPGEPPIEAGRGGAKPGGPGQKTKPGRDERSPPGTKECLRDRRQKVR